ncbi:MAG: hypothetical protein HQ549_06190 [Candidatus Omnitrophica bacterium]|nr:hypothetical protein [Candidatus Omnitrophota bacterium]
MTKYILSLVFLMTLTTGAAYAHPPNSMGTRYNREDKTLEIHIVHPVRNPKKHYVEKVTIAKNGDPAVTKEFTEQENDKVQNVIFELVDVDPEDIVVIEAHCSISGKLKGKLDLSKLIK